MSVERIGKGYVKICVSGEELENSIAGLSQLKPILQTQVMKGNGRNTKQGLIDAAELGTHLRQITVGIHGKGGETGIKAIMLLTALINDLKQCKTPQEVYDGYLQITGYCKCCVDCDFIEEKDADELMHLAAYLAGNEQARTEAQQKAGN